MLPDSLPDAGVLVRCSHTAMLHVTLAHVMCRTVEPPRLPVLAVLVTPILAIGEPRVLDCGLQGVGGRDDDEQARGFDRARTTENVRCLP